ncbi:MAG: hypothetical protein DWQ34_23070 [Planctomycetota bacterium]|nr:MAG: hypothetical protein DWQ29_10025 [Planctomycetota bacterium]REJ88150.1 MAG: hypothetical protein DWQ34_23070 [Planctomycetota bacterium]REK27391.1 MAG: hypothetical protein DWQ41_08510 [Planctomycetota bacterium]REK36588.1 MAG: hypothetical protein DWQ45_08120 [Planctomycetota bacterium]
MSDHSIKLFPPGCRDFDFLRPSVEATFATIDSFVEKQTRSTDIELPYWSNERATLSQLAAGICRSNTNNLVVEEYQCTKGTVDEPWKGRRDLWFRIEDQICHAEAKQSGICWPCVGRFTQRDAESCVRLAIEEARASERDSIWTTSHRTYATSGDDVETERRKPRCFGIVFITPYVTLENQPQWESEFRRFSDVIHSALASVTKAEEHRFMWARYFRADLLKKSLFFDSPYYKTWISMPELDILICESGSGQ